LGRKDLLSFAGAPVSEGGGLFLGANALGAGERALSLAGGKDRAGDLVLKEAGRVEAAADLLVVLEDVAVVIAEVKSCGALGTDLLDEGITEENVEEEMALDLEEAGKDPLAFASVAFRVLEVAGN